jgi:hypothetical protein
VVSIVNRLQVQKYRNLFSIPPGQEVLLFSRASKPALGPYFNAYQRQYPTLVKGLKLKLITNLHTAPSLNMGGAIPPLS